MSQLSFELIFIGAVSKSGSGRSRVLTACHPTTEKTKRVALMASIEIINTGCGTASAYGHYKHTIVITSSLSFRMRCVISAALVECILNEFAFTRKQKQNRALGFIL